jgi:glutamate 5-kinase
MIVAHGRTENILSRLLDGEQLGTLFVPAGRKLSSRSRWIGSVRPAGTIYVDDGAVTALVEKNKSLLAAGVIKVQGEFGRGDVIAICAGTGVAIAQGLSNYSAADVERIRGKRTAEVRSLLAEAAYDEVVHRDNLVVV